MPRPMQRLLSCRESRASVFPEPVVASSCMCRRQSSRVSHSSRPRNRRLACPRHIIPADLSHVSLRRVKRKRPIGPLNSSAFSRSVVISIPPISFGIRSGIRNSCPKNVSNQIEVARRSKKLSEIWRWLSVSGPAPSTSLSPGHCWVTGRVGRQT